MERDSSGHLQQVLRRDLNALLEQDGTVLVDRYIPVAPNLVNELDVVDIVLARNPNLPRTVCHIHQPSTEEYYWRHETFVTWDDGRTAQFRVDIALDEQEARIMYTNPRNAHRAFSDELKHLIYGNILDAGSAQDVEHMVLVDLTKIVNEVEEALLKYEEVEELDSAVVIAAVIADADAHLPVEIAPSAELDRLYESIRALRRAHYVAIELRNEITNRYLATSDVLMSEAEADPTSTAPSQAIWNLLELLDKIR